MKYLRRSRALPNDSKHNEASFSTISTDMLHLRVAQTPRSPDLAIFCDDRWQTKPITLSLAHARGVKTDIKRNSWMRTLAIGSRTQTHRHYHHCRRCEHDCDDYVHQTTMIQSTFLLLWGNYGVTYSVIYEVITKSPGPASMEPFCMGLENMVRILRVYPANTSQVAC